MRIVGEYSFNKGKEEVTTKYPDLVREIVMAIQSVDASSCKVKRSREKTMPGKILYSPVHLNGCFKRALSSSGWQRIRVQCSYPITYYVGSYSPSTLNPGAFREMDFV